MPTFLLTWNSDPDNWDIRRADSKNIRAGRRRVFRWLCGNSKQIHKGDRVFLLKQGPEPRGLIGSGRADSDWEVYEKSGHIEKTRVHCTMDTLLDHDRKPVLQSETLSKAGVPLKIINTRPSGVRISDPIARIMERLWKRHKARLIEATNAQLREGRDVLMLWRGSEVESAEGRSLLRSAGPQTQGLRSRDRVFLCAFHEGQIYLLGVFKVTSLKKSRRGNLAMLKSDGGPARRVAIGDAVRKLRFQGKRDRLPRRGNVASALQAHRFLTPKSAKLLLDLLGINGGAHGNGGRTHICKLERELDQLDEVGALEGQRTTVIRTIPKRLANLRRKKILDAKRRNGGRLICEVPNCAFDFEARYGRLGRDYCIVHHRHLVSGKVRNTTLDDLAVLCANCHAMIHRNGKCRRVDELKIRSSATPR